MSQKLKGVHNSLEVIENRKKKETSPKKEKEKSVRKAGPKKQVPRYFAGQKLKRPKEAARRRRRLMVHFLLIRRRQE